MAAKTRWGKLRSVLLSNAKHVPNSSNTSRNNNSSNSSQTRHAGFTLFSKRCVAECASGHRVTEYDILPRTNTTASLPQPSPSIASPTNNNNNNVKQKKLQVHEKIWEARLQDLVAAQQCDVDNTGNVCLWPSEEVLGWVLLSLADSLNGKRVCELGAGMTGLAGMALACVSQPAEILITDGNPQCAECLQRNIQANMACSTSSQCLLLFRLLLRSVRAVVVVVASGLLRLPLSASPFLPLSLSLCFRLRSSVLFVVAACVGVVPIHSHRISRSHTR